MTAIFRNETISAQALSFVDQFQQDSASVISNRLYAGISDTRGNDLSGDALSATDRTTSYLPGANELSFWYDPTNGAAGAKIVGVQKFEEAKISPVVARQDWATATTYAVGDYVIAENNVNVIDVFICVAIGATPVSDTKPEYAAGLNVDNTYYKDGKASLINDGGASTLVWRYLCRLPTAMSDALADTNWIPIPYNQSIGTNSPDNDVNNSRLDAYELLTGKHVMLKIELLADSGGINLPDSGSYSKVALIKNPLKIDGSVCTATSYLSPLLSDDGTNPFPSGEMVFLEHRGSISRQSNQTEVIKVVLAL